MYSKFTKEQNIERVVNLNENLGEIIEEFRKELLGIECGSTKEYEFETNCFSIYRKESEYFVLEYPKIIDEGWKEGDLCVYKMKNLSRLITRLIEEKY